MIQRCTFHTLLFVAALAFLGSCTEQAGKGRGPIVLGNPATIVTETDSQYLQDQVPDIEPVQAPQTEPVPAPDTVARQAVPPVKDTAKPVPVAALKPAAVNGLNMAFREVTISIPGITTRSYSKSNLQNANSASYELTDGNISNNQLVISGARTVSKVQQRYQTVAVVNSNGKILPLTSLGTYSSDWQALKGRGTAYVISGLEPRKLEYTDVTPANLRNAVQKAARSARLSKKEEQQLLKVRSIKAANQSPCAVIMRSVMWRVEGTGADGKKFNKEIRIDGPL